MIDLKTTRVKPVEDTLTLVNAIQITTTEEKSFVVFTDLPAEKEAWLKDFKRLTEQANDLENSAPVWIPDNQAKNCMICTKGFTMVNRRHHCRYSV